MQTRNTSLPRQDSNGPRASAMALVSAAMEPSALGQLQPSGQLASLKEVIHNNWMVSEYPEMFCFGLLQGFDVPQLQALASQP